MLDFSNLSSSINSTYDLQKNNKSIPSGSQVPYVLSPGTEWMDSFIDLYDIDANNGVFTFPSVVMENKKNDLVFNINNPLSPIDGLGATIANYWSSQLTPGTPQYCANIVSVTNDASKIELPIRNYLISQISTLKNPPYEHLFSFIETQVKSIIWTINESGPECTSNYIVNIV